MGEKLLIVEDDKKLNDGIRLALKNDAYFFYQCRTLQEAREILKYLIDEVWQGDTEFVDAHALTVAIKRLRDKLEDDVQKPKYIKTVYGIGYTWR